jgi:integrase/recombinase XerD
MEAILLHQFAEKLELQGYSKRSIADYPALVKLFFEYLNKEEDVHTVEAIEPEHVIAYHGYLQYNKLKRGNGYLSGGAVINRLKAVKTFFTIMHEEGLIKQEYASVITLPKIKKHLPRHVPSEKDMQELLAATVPADPITTRDRALLELLYATGLRNEEVRTLETGAVDLTEKTVFVTGKGSKDRVVPLGEWVIPYLREYLETARPLLVNVKKPVELLFLSKNGRKITHANLGYIIGKYAHRAGIEHPLTPHSFRHACATHLLKNGADIRYVQELLGHADLSSTQIYTKLDISFLKKAHAQYHPRERMQHDS